ncbi:MAG TPA: hypothetical protein PKD51_17145 [Saprospiraceae bacterium]|nr:hypothetical protein [Saprospiraceae bacterium]HMU03981.1 hypothetical protein [Saprospiraceae bacterium]
MKSTFFTLFLLLTAIFSYSQNYLFNENQSGLNFTGRLSSFDNIDVFGFNAGFTINSRLTLGVDLELRHSEIYDNKRSFSPYLNCLLVRQNNQNRPITINLHSYYKNLKNTDYDASKNSFGLGLGFYRSYNLKSNIVIIPGGTLEWSSGSLDLYGDEYAESNIVYGLNISGKFNNFYLTPGVLFTNGKQIFEIDFGILLVGDKKQ